MLSLVHDRVQNSSGSGLIFMKVSGSGLLGFENYHLIGFISGSALIKSPNPVGFSGLWVQENF